jgi:hypothetical protein
MRVFKTFIIALTAVFGAIACNPDTGGEGGNDKPTSEWSKSGSPVGEWKLTSWNGNTENLPFGIYLRLNADNTFDLYQHTYTVLWIHYSGTFTLNGNTLKGVYADGESWGGDYTIAYSASEPQRIRLTRTTANGEDVCIYTATEIPSDVEDLATEALNVRSVAIERFL